jgi:hypothetical protein
MIRLTQLLLAAVMSLMVFSACKKTKSVPGARTHQESTDKPLASAFVTKSPVVVYASPDTNSKVVATLPMGVQVGIFESRVPDKVKPDEAFWYRIKYAPLSASLTPSSQPVEGYVSEREEVLRNNLMVFQAADNVTYLKETAPGKFEDVKEAPAVMATTAVNLRQSPALNAPTLRTLKHGEVLALEEESAKTYLVDNKNARWYKLRSQTGEVGYAFGGFMVYGPASEMKRLEEAGFQFQNGWVTPVIGAATVYAGPVGNARIHMTEQMYYIPDAWHSNNGTLEKNIYLKTDGMTTKGEPQRYRIAVQYWNDIGGLAEQYFYVDKSAVKIIRDYYSVSEKQPHEFDAELAPLVNKFINGNLNLQCSSVKEFSGGPAETPRQFKVITAARGASRTGADNTERCDLTERQMLVAEVIGDKLVLSKSHKGEFRDLDGDQIPEIVHKDGGRGYQLLEIYSIKQGRTDLIASFGGNETKYDANERFIDEFFVDEDGYLHLDAKPYACTHSDEKGCAEQLAAARKAAKSLKFLKFDPGLPPLPFKGKLEGDTFVQVANDAG